MTTVSDQSHVWVNTHIERSWCWYVSCVHVLLIHD